MVTNETLRSGGGGGAGSGDGYPLQGRRWLRLCIIFACSFVGTSLTLQPGAWNLLLTQAGVGSSRCERGESTCREQALFLTEMIGLAMVPAFAAQLLVGWVFDRFGGRVSSALAATILTLGCALWQIPLQGALHGHDAQTSAYLVVALMTSLVGGTFSTNNLLTMAWHFPEHQTLICGLCVSTVFSPALVPLLMAVLIDITGLPLSSLMLGWLVPAVFSGAVLLYMVPNQKEYRLHAASAIGTVLPDKVSSWQVMKNALLVWQDRCWLHILGVLYMGCNITQGMILTSSYGEWGKLLFGSEGAGKELAWLATTSWGIFGTLLPPAVGYFADMCGGPSAVMWILLVLSIANATFLAIPVWPAQVALALCAPIEACVGMVFFVKYALAFTGPIRLGTGIGYLDLGIAFVTAACQSFDFSWISSLPSSDPMHLRLPLLSTSIFAKVILALWIAGIRHVGFPSRPVMLSSSEQGQPLLHPSES